MLILVTLPMSPTIYTARYFICSSQRSSMSVHSTWAAVLLRRPAPWLRNCTRPRTAIHSNLAWASRRDVFTSQRRLRCNKNESSTTLCSSEDKKSASLTIPQFWTSRATWKRAAVNTFRCLIGCTAGDFSAMWYLQLSHPALGMGTIMAISSASTLGYPVQKFMLTLCSGFRHQLFHAFGDYAPPIWLRPSPLDGCCSDGCGNEHDLDAYDGAGGEHS
jgi:hypothetical protein